MHFSTVARGTAVLAALSGTAAGVVTSPFKRDLKLSAELGIHPDTLLGHKTSVQAVASGRLMRSLRQNMFRYVSEFSMFVEDKC